ncbi:hypothetical protein OG884_26160 [Streptosporangium sp. NBC_01755]|uniref:hypothetical protein n=1 Tax=Streptosporangium sp. NBC_01755 TaxID=2975949 RepID=UPI002DD7EFB2|nr:hypothetical protein [Streptosporangium sp. NBC_01755]WSC98339.1 hypothetical protein OG884_26160 [Streptosporangium sp. NBC_01755]
MSGEREDRDGSGVAEDREGLWDCEGSRGCEGSRDFGEVGESEEFGESWGLSAAGPDEDAVGEVSTTARTTPYPPMTTSSTAKVARMM